MASFWLRFLGSRLFSAFSWLRSLKKQSFKLALSSLVRCPLSVEKPSIPLSTISNLESSIRNPRPLTPSPGSMVFIVQSSSFIVPRFLRSRLLSTESAYTLAYHISPARSNAKCPKKGTPAKMGLDPNKEPTGSRRRWARCTSPRS